MKKNGFTLIELLAVIVILAIIALIATPIILGIINDAREESNERSVELYASAVRNAIAAYQLTGTSAPKSFADLDVQYDGNVECATEELYEDGSFYIADCTVNGTEVEYTYGEQQVTQPTRYYSWSFGTIGGDLPSDATQNVSELDTLGQSIYLGLDVDDENKVTAAYVCFKRDENGSEYCIKGVDTEAFSRNKTDLEYAFKDVENACQIVDDLWDKSISCKISGLNAGANAGGEVSVYSSWCSCDVYANGNFRCIEN